MKRYRISISIIIFALTAVMLSGCSGKSSGLQQEYKDLAISQFESGDYESALVNFQKALDSSKGFIRSQETDICYYKAQTQIYLDDVEGAIETYTALIEYDDDNWESYYLRGIAYLLIEDLESALSDLDMAVSLNSKDIELYINICENLFDSGNSDSAQQYLEAAASLSPSSAEDYADLAYVFYLSGDDDTALEYALEAADGGYSAAYLTIGKVYASEGDTDQAMQAFESYLDAFPDDADAYNSAGTVMAETGDYASAAQYFEQGLSLAEGSVKKQIWKNLIAALEQELDFDEALIEAESFLEEYPDDEDILKEYEFLRTR